MTVQAGFKKAQAIVQGKEAQHQVANSVCPCSSQRWLQHIQHLSPLGQKGGCHRVRNGARCKQHRWDSVILLSIILYVASNWQPLAASQPCAEVAASNVGGLVHDHCSDCGCSTTGIPKLRVLLQTLEGSQQSNSCYRC